ncbi:MAG: GNAT family N-acetyltransferase [Fimbriimonadaceae bacterium]
MTIRRLQPTDSIEDLTALIHRAYQRLGEMGLNYTAVNQGPEVTLERVLEGECWLAEMHGATVGTAVLSFPEPYRESGRAYVNQFAVEPDLQGMGIGSALLQHLEERAREVGCHEIGLDTAESAGHLVRFYETRGYQFVEYVQFEGKTYRSVILVKLL